MKVRRGTLPTDNFTILSNQWLRDREISHRARGLLALIASHHEEYEFELDDLKTPKDGRDALTTAAKELEEAGYLKRVRTRNPNGSLGPYIWLLQEPTPSADNPI
jgi:hypothetical protein